MTDEPQLLDVAVMAEVLIILAEGRVMADRDAALKRWRRACEWLIRHRSVSKPAAAFVRGLFAEGKKRRS